MRDRELCAADRSLIAVRRALPAAIRSAHRVDRAPPGSFPVDRVPSTRRGQAIHLVARPEHREHALVLARVPALAVLLALALAPVPEQAEHRLRLAKHLVRSAPPRVVVAAASSSTPRLKKAQ